MGWFEDLFIRDVKAVLPKGGPGGGDPEDSKRAQLYKSILEGTVVDIEDDWLESIDTSAFRSRNFESVKFGNVTTIGAQAFVECFNLTTANFPAATSIGEGAFNSCNALTTANFPVATNIGNNAFDNCDNLSTADFPKATTIGDYAFYDCVNLTTADFPKATSIGELAFYNCINLSTLIIRTSELCDINISALVATNIVTIDGAPTGEGFIYIPSALYEAYIADFTPKIVALATEGGIPMDEPTATYIATAILRKIEDYTVDGTTTGELDESKI